MELGVLHHRKRRSATEKLVPYEVRHQQEDESRTRMKGWKKGRELVFTGSESDSACRDSQSNPPSPRG